MIAPDLRDILMSSFSKTFVTICCVGCAAACFACAAIVDERPELSVISDPATVDLGIVPPQVVRKCEVALVNHGRSAVKVANTASSCGCTDIAVSAKTLSPGQAAVLSVKLKSGAGPGEWTSTVAVDFVNDQGDRHHVVSVPIHVRVESSGQLAQSP